MSATSRSDTSTLATVDTIAAGTQEPHAVNTNRRRLVGVDANDGLDGGSDKDAEERV